MAHLWIETLTGARHYLSPHPTSPVTALRYSPGRGDGETASEVIEFTLKGTPAVVADYLSALGRLLAQAEREARIPGGAWVCLCLEESGGGEWQSLLLGGRVQTGPAGPDQRLGGLQACRLEARRADWWDAAEPAPLYKTALSGGDLAGLPLTLHNHADAEHGNIIDLPPLNGGTPNVTGDLPAPLTLHIQAITPGTRPWTFVVGESLGSGADQTAPAYQGESGSARGSTGGALTPDASCANGVFIDLTWTGAGDVELWSCDLDAADVKRMGGQAFRPLLRLREGLDPTASEKLWYRWKIYRLSGAGEYLVRESPSMYMEQGSELVVGPAVCLPPWLVDGSSPIPAGGLRLVLAGSAAGSGAHALKIDFVQLFGLSGWCIYRPLTGEPTRGLLHDQQRGTLTTLSEDYPSHTVEGPGLHLKPGEAHRLIFIGLRHDPGGYAAPVDETWGINFTYRPRRRTL